MEMKKMRKILKENRGVATPVASMLLLIILICAIAIVVPSWSKANVSAENRTIAEVELYLRMLDIQQKETNLPPSILVYPLDGTIIDAEDFYATDLEVLVTDPESDMVRVEIYWDSREPSSPLVEWELLRNDVGYNGSYIQFHIPLFVASVPHPKLMTFDWRIDIFEDGHWFCELHSFQYWHPHVT